MEVLQDAGDVDVAAVASMIKDYGRGAGQEQFAGLVIAAATGDVTVYRVPGGAFDAHLLALVDPRVRVRFADARHSRVELRRARDAVWEMAGVPDIRAMSIRADGSAVVVVVGGDAATAQSWFDAALPGLVTVERARR